MFAKLILAISALVSPCVALLGPAIRPRHPAPSFKAKAVLHDKFIDVSLAEYTREGLWTVLLFYPFDFTFVCPTEIISFSEHNEDFKNINTQVLAISTDSHHTHLAWVRTAREEGGLFFFIFLYLRYEKYYKIVLTCDIFDSYRCWRFINPSRR